MGDESIVRQKDDFSPARPPLPLCVALLWLATPVGAATPDRHAVQVTLVDGAAIGYATFQSHNQKVVANRHGIFMTHLRTRDEAYLAQTWRLSRSTDKGRSFRTIFADTHPTNPPVLETDSAGNVYLMRVDFNSGDGVLYRFLAANDFKKPKISRVPRAAAGKYAMLLDPQRDQLFFFSHNNTFHRLRGDGKVTASLELLRPGRNAILQYPLLSLDEAGRLHAAWTTQKHNEYLYWDIHHMVSRDAGMKWQNLDKQSLQLPVVADDTGKAMRITRDDEFTSHTWLSSMLAQAGKLHFLYLAQTEPPRQHYIRYDIAGGLRDVDVSPKFQGDKIALQGLDGFFVADAAQPSTIYCVGNDDGRLACLVSHDNGTTWQDHARTQQRFHLYSIGGYRTTTAEGWIIGSFTDQAGSNLTTDRSSKVYFFKIPAQ